MHITELEIDNFKSFSKKTKIPFLEGFSVISGPNGSGKTSLLRAMSGLLKPQSGSLALDGKGLASYRRDNLARRVALVPQSAVLPELFNTGYAYEEENYARAYELMQGIAPGKMLAVGGTGLRRYFVAGPLQGAAGALLAGTGLYFVNSILAQLVPGLLQLPPESLIILFVLGCFLGFLGSLLAIKRYL